MKILSLFDGISCARVALERAGIPVEAYYASEIDKYAMQISSKNYPDIVQVGSVVDLVANKNSYGNGQLFWKDKEDYKSSDAFTGFDLLIGGSPCQDLSIAKRDRKGLDGERSGLFWEYVRILKEVKPKYFILENVYSMPKEAKAIITETLGVEPIMIDASLVSAQQRKRIFWTNIPNITQPKNRNIHVEDIIESGEAVMEKAYYITTNQKDFINDFIKRSQGNYVFKDRPIRVASLGKGGQGDRVYSIKGKTVCLSANGGGRGAKTGLYLITGGAKRTKDGIKKLEIRKDGKANVITSVSTDSLVVLKDYFRALTPIETERCQSLPDNYTEGVSKTTRKKLCGNAFNVDVAAHILSFINPSPAIKEISS